MGADEKSQGHIQYLKGAPEIILKGAFIMPTYLLVHSSHLPPSFLPLSSILLLVVLACDKIMIKGQVEEMNDVYRRAYENAYKDVAEQGERVLALAMQTLDYTTWPRDMTKQHFKAREEELPRTGFTFLGLMSLVDPPKDGVGEAVIRCKTAGVRVAMITGDHPLTAEAIARKVGRYR